MYYSCFSDPAHDQTWPQDLVLPYLAVAAAAWRRTLPHPEDTAVLSEHDKKGSQWHKLLEPLVSKWQFTLEAHAISQTWDTIFFPSIKISNTLSISSYKYRSSRSRLPLFNEIENGYQYTISPEQIVKVFWSCGEEWINNTASVMWQSLIKFSGGDCAGFPAPTSSTSKSQGVGVKT